MSLEQELARLNVLLEFFEACAAATNIDALVQTVHRRLCWAIDFDRCATAVITKDAVEYWEGPRKVDVDGLTPGERDTLRRVLGSGSTFLDGNGHALGIPLLSAERVVGALCLSHTRAPYARDEVRLAHHASRYLGTLVERLDLERTARRLNERKDEFLALLGHELRNPLAPIVTAVELLKLRAPGAPSKELLAIDRHSKHLVRLIDELLDVARLTRGNIALTKAPVEVESVIARAIDMSRPLLDQRRHSLRVDIPEVGLCAEADEARLAQVFANILKNAARYTDEGGHITITARRDGNIAIVDVSDDGIGIAPEALEDIFEFFAQRSLRSSKQGGLGLGLAVAKQVTELHGGSVSAASGGPNRGSTFTVRLPCLPPGFELPAPETSPALAPSVENAERILVVDDNDDALELLGILLRSVGHEVAVAHDGPEALSILREFHPSVAVLDLGLPVMDGYELAQKIGEELGDEKPYLVALTGYGQERDRERTRDAGFGAHVVKPVDAQELLRVVGTAPGRS